MYYLRINRSRFLPFWIQNLKTSDVFIIDKERHQRGRFDDRDKDQMKQIKHPYTG